MVAGADPGSVMLISKSSVARILVERLYLDLSLRLWSGFNQVDQPKIGKPPAPGV